MEIDRFSSLKLPLETGALPDSPSISISALLFNLQTASEMEENPLAASERLTGARILTPLIVDRLQSDEIDAETAWETMDLLKLLLGPKIKSNSPFLKDEEIAKKRLMTFEALVPAFTALAQNPRIEEYHLKEFVYLIETRTEDEVFPSRLHEKVPPANLEERFQLGEKIINFCHLLTQHPNADCKTLEFPIMIASSIPDYHRFSASQKTLLLKQTLPVLTSAAIHPRGDAQWTIRIMRSIFNPESNHGEKLLKADRFFLADEVLSSINEILSGKADLIDYEVKEIFTTLTTAVFADEYTAEEKLALLTKAVPILKLIAEKHLQRETIDQLYELLEFTPDETGLAILEGLVDDMIEELDEAFQEGLGLVPEGEKDPFKIAAIIRSSPKSKKTEALMTNPDEVITAYILQLNLGQGLGFYGQLMNIKEFLKYVKTHPELGPVPGLVLPLNQESQPRQNLLEQINQIIQTMKEKAADNSLVRYHLSPLETFYWLYSTLPYQEQRTK